MQKGGAKLVAIDIMRIFFFQKLKTVMSRKAGRRLSVLLEGVRLSVRLKIIKQTL